MEFRGSRDLEKSHNLTREYKSSQNLIQMEKIKITKENDFRVITKTCLVQYMCRQIHTLLTGFTGKRVPFCIFCRAYVNLPRFPVYFQTQFLRKSSHFWGLFEHLSRLSRKNSFPALSLCYHIGTPGRGYFLCRS